MLGSPLSLMLFQLSYVQEHSAMERYQTHDNVRRTLTMEAGLPVKSKYWTGEHRYPRARLLAEAFCRLSQSLLANIAFAHARYSLNQMDWLPLMERKPNNAPYRMAIERGRGRCCADPTLRRLRCGP